jgi:hypothetical protein
LDAPRTTLLGKTRGDFFIKIMYMQQKQILSSGDLFD